MKRIMILTLIGAVSFFASATYAIICGNDVCGDANADGVVNILDVSAMINFCNCWQNGPDYCDEMGEWICEDNLDVDGDGAFKCPDDYQYLIDYLYRGGPAPVCP